MKIYGQTYDGHEVMMTLCVHTCKKALLTSISVARVLVVVELK